MLIAQITDSHCVAAGEVAYAGQVETNLLLERTVNRLNALDPRPDLVVHTGDLADHGQPAEYAEFTRIMARLQIPCCVTIGNHDDRPTLLASLANDYPYLAGLGPSVRYAVEDYPVRLVVLDSCADEPPSPRAAFGAERCAWLAARLAEAPDKPTIVALHHPPFGTGIALIDADGPGWADGLAEVLARSPNVERVLCGHVHRSIQTLVGGRLATVCPSTTYAVRFELRDPPTGKFMEMEPPGFQLHRWRDGRLVTHTLSVNRYREADPVPDGPVRFR